MVRFPGPFNKSKKKQKKLQKENGLVNRAPNSFSSVEEGTDFYSDLEEVMLAATAAANCLCFSEVALLVTQCRSLNQGHRP